MLARGRMDLPLTLCFATLRGDDLLLHHLLKRGLDPNESDNNGRSALVSIITIFCYTKVEFYVTTFLIFPTFLLIFSHQHIAASKGIENCVVLLLDFGADPNSRGIYILRFYFQNIVAKSLFSSKH